MNIEVVFNSGAASEFSFGSGDNISNIGIKNTVKGFFETANISINDIGDNKDNLDINTPVDIYIDDDHEFSGYINRIKKKLDGSLVFDISCIGKTSVLSRFNTDSDTTFTEKYSGYIVSSLTNNFASGNGDYIIPPDINDTTGNLIDYIDLSNKSLNSCFSTLSNFDGYRYYVGNDDKLKYNTPSNDSQFTITHDDIKGKMSIEKSDDSIRNKVLVIGSQEFGTEVQEGELPSDGWYTISTSRLVAQRMSVPNTYSGGQHHTKFYASSTAEIPSYIECDLYTDSSDEPGTILASSNIKWNGTSISNREGWMDYKENADHLDVNLSSQAVYWSVFKSDCTDSDSYWKLAYDTQGAIDFDFSSDPNIEDTLDYGGEDYGYVVYDSGDNDIDFYLKPLGYPSSATFDNTKCNRYRDVPVSTASYPDGITKDNIKFKISANVLEYNYISSLLYDELRVDYWFPYERYIPRAYIAITSDNEATYDYDPMFGFEYSLYSPIIESFDRGYIPDSYLYSDTGEWEVQSDLTISSPSSLKLEGDANLSILYYVLHRLDEEIINKVELKLRPGGCDTGSNGNPYSLYLQSYNDNDVWATIGELEFTTYGGDLLIDYEDNHFGTWASGSTYTFSFELTDGGENIFVNCPTIGSSQTYATRTDYDFSTLDVLVFYCKSAD